MLSVLFFHPSGMHLKVSDPKCSSNDKLVLSKGHAAPILYAAWAEAGLFPTSELQNLRKITSDLEGHPTPRLNFIDIATGSLGQGLSAACGMAYSVKYLEQSSAKVFTIMGDAESAEGSVWEAMNFASHYKLDNMIAIFDINRLGQSDPTMFQHDIQAYRARAEAFGWKTIVIDGHSVDEIVAAFNTARNSSGSPTAIIAKTFKGRDFEGIENLPNWHGKPLGDKAAGVIQQLKQKIQGNSKPSTTPPRSSAAPPLPRDAISQPLPNYDRSSKVATRNAYGDGLKALGSDARIVGLDGDTKNSTMSQGFQLTYPKRFVECFVAEQNMIGTALGLSTRGWIPFCSTFAAFFSRTFDQVRLAAISEGNVKMVGSHCGVSIGEDGSSQMGLEDLAMFRSIPGALVLYPSDAVSAYRAVQLAANHKGVAYIRTSRPATAVLYENSQVFEAKSYVVRKSDNDVVTIVAAGVTLHEALKAADELKKNGTHVRVVDLFAVKPVDRNTILEAARQTGGKVITVEDHYPEGGIFEAVSSALAADNVRVWGLNVRELPRSGQPNELLQKYGISAKRIEEKVAEILRIN
jgi:transketolase